MLSFRAVAADDADLASAERDAGTQLAGLRRYRFQIYRWGEEGEDPDDIQTILVEILEQAEAYVAGNTVLLRRADGPWVVDRSMPT